MKSIVDVHNFLQNEEIQHEILSLPQEIRSAQRASMLLGVPLHEVIKTIVLFLDKKAYIAIIPGDMRIDEEKTMKATGSLRVRLAKHAEVQQLTGFMVKAMPPFCLSKGLLCLIDKRVLDQDVVYGGGGEIDKILKIRSEDLKQLTGAVTADIAS